MPIRPGQTLTYPHRPQVQGLHSSFRVIFGPYSQATHDVGSLYSPYVFLAFNDVDPPLYNPRVQTLGSKPWPLTAPEYGP